MGCSQSKFAFDAVAPAPDGNVSDDYHHRSDQQSRLSYFGMKMKRGIAPLPIFRKEPKSSSQSMGQGQAVIFNGRFSPEAISGQVSMMPVEQGKSNSKRDPVNVTRGVGDNLKLSVDAIEPKPQNIHPKQGVVGGQATSPLFASNGATNSFDPSSTISPQRNAIGPLSVVDAHLAATHITAENGLQYRDKISNPTNFIAAVKKGDMTTIRTLVTASTNITPSPGDKLLINTTGMWNTSPLMTAIQYGHLAVADYLLQQSDIDVNHANERGSTAMLLACADGYAALVKRLLDLGK